MIPYSFNDLSFLPESPFREITKFYYNPCPDDAHFIALSEPAYNNILSSFNTINERIELEIGCSVEATGCSVEAIGCSVGATGCSVAATGCSVEATGYPVVTTGCSVATTGFSVVATGYTLAATGFPKGTILSSKFITN